MSDLRLEISDELGRRVVPVEKDVFTLGRRTGNDLRLVGTDISRDHAELARDGQQYILRDRQSRFGTIQLQPGDLLVMFSDGISEALDAAGEEFGDDRILACLRRSGQGSVSQILECLVTTVKEFAAGTMQSDDMTAVVMRYGSRA
jgi:serine/threonine protein phosphatase PrpC